MKHRLTALLGHWLPANSETKCRPPPKCNKYMKVGTGFLTTPHIFYTATCHSRLSIPAMGDRCCKNILCAVTDVFHNLTLWFKEFQKVWPLFGLVDSTHSRVTEEVNPWHKGVIHQLTFAWFLTTCNFGSYFKPHNSLLTKSISFVTLQSGSGATALARREHFGLQGHGTVTASVSYEILASSRSRFDKKMSVFWMAALWDFPQVLLNPPSCLINPSTSVRRHTKDNMILTPGPDWWWPGGLQASGGIVWANAWGDDSHIRKE